jgi:hypothetical protein
MALIDCDTDNQNQCGYIMLIANLSAFQVRIDVQYPGNEAVWYAIGALKAGSKFQSGASSVRYPRGTLLRAAKIDKTEYFLMGRVVEEISNVFLVPENAFRVAT